MVVKMVVKRRQGMDEHRVSEQRYRIPQAQYVG
jgi:hypothetical protein